MGVCRAPADGGVTARLSQWRAGAMGELGVWSWWWLVTWRWCWNVCSGELCGSLLASDGGVCGWCAVGTDARASVDVGVVSRVA